MTLVLAHRRPLRLPLSGPLPAIVALVVAGLGTLSGLPLSGELATTLACLSLLVFGLPHGTLDLEIIRDRLSGPWTGLVILVGIYLALAGLTYGLWRVQPVLALAAFIAIAVAHFAEDWDGAGSALLQGGMALALLAAPTLFYRAELDLIFAGLTGRTGAPVISDLLLLVAPVALATGLVCVVTLWQAGRREQAAGGLAALTGMVILPPIIGFALYFCLFHSPRHFREGLATLDWRGFARWGRVVVPLTLAAGAIGALIFAVEVRSALPQQVMAASFMTLSILTVPHMLVPRIIRRLAQRRGGTGERPARVAF